MEKYQGDIYDQEVIKAKELIQPYDWKNVAVSWNEKLDSMFIERSTNNRQAILDQLTFYSDIVAAKELSGEQQYDDLIKMNDQPSSIEFGYSISFIFEY